MSPTQPVQVQVELRSLAPSNFTADTEAEIKHKTSSLKPTTIDLVEVASTTPSHSANGPGEGSGDDKEEDGDRDELGDGERDRASARSAKTTEPAASAGASEDAFPDGGRGWAVVAGCFLYSAVTVGWGCVCFLTSPFSPSRSRSEPCADVLAFCGARVPSRAPACVRAYVHTVWYVGVAARDMRLC